MEKFFIIVKPVIIYPPCLKEGKPQDCIQCDLRTKGGCQTPRSRCISSYKNHKNGCPNYGKRPHCPPFVPMFDQVFDIQKPIYAIYYKFDLKSHVNKMRTKHPTWTEAQLYNVLYWQGTARKKLIENIYRFKKLLQDQSYYATIIPEAMGVDITKTLRAVNIDLEWPAKNWVYKIALAGSLLDLSYIDNLKLK